MVPVEAVRWWPGVWAGTTALEAVTTWGWVKVGFYHAAVVIGMPRGRARSGTLGPSAGADRGA